MTGITGKTRDYDKLQKNNGGWRRATRKKAEVDALEERLLLGSRENPDLRHELNGNLRLRDIQGRPLRQGGNQTVMLRLSRVVVEALMQFLGSGQPKQREPEAKHQRRSGRLGEAADAGECGFRAQRFQIKQNDLVPRKENLRQNRQAR